MTITGIQTEPYTVADGDLLGLLGLSNPPSPVGSWAGDHTKGAAAILTLLVSRGLSLSRDAEFADRRLSVAPEGRFEEASRPFLDADRNNRLAGEMAALYVNTSRWLKATNQTEVLLHRAIYDRTDFGAPGFATLIARRAAAAKKLGEPSFKMELDTLSSWWLPGNCFYGAPGTYEVGLKITFPACDIAWVHHRIDKPVGAGMDCGAEDGEWVVINRNDRGVVDVCPEAVEELTPEGQQATRNWLDCQSTDDLEKLMKADPPRRRVHRHWSV